MFEFLKLFSFTQTCFGSFLEHVSASLVTQGKENKPEETAPDLLIKPDEEKIKAKFVEQVVQVGQKMIAKCTEGKAVLSRLSQDVKQAFTLTA